MTSHRAAIMTGSLSFPTVDEVFEHVPAIVGSAIKRIPDGEPGARNNWVGWQTETFARTPGLRRANQAELGTEYGLVPIFTLDRDVDYADIEFPPLGYADAAIESWGKFSARKQRGYISPEIRFQVSLPTTVPLLPFFLPKDQKGIEQAVKTALLIELNRIAENIPHDQLAIQWDVAAEVAMLETDIFDSFLKNDLAGIIDRLARLGDAVPADIELGYHLCYGGQEGKHFKEPADLGLLVKIANGIFDNIHRPVNWIHMPVPINRDDDAYFVPLDDLRLLEKTELYLGLLHLGDGISGAKRRIASASRHIPGFGVSTECGMCGRDAEWTLQMLHLFGEAVRV
jgi:hypothetical protein